MSSKPQATLILFSGLPGSGKTTLAVKTASHFHLPLFSKDRFQSFLLKNHLAGRSTADGYHLMMDQTDQQLSLGVSVILDAVFPLPGFRSRLKEISAQYNALFRPVYCYCSSNPVWEKRMLNRSRLVPDWTPVGWEEVLRLKNIFTPWDPQEALFLDSINNPEENFGTLKTWINLNK